MEILLRPAGEQTPVRLRFVARQMRLTKISSMQYHYDWHIAIYLSVAVFPLLVISPEAGGQLHAGLFVLRCDVTNTP